MKICWTFKTKQRWRITISHFVTLWICGTIILLFSWRESKGNPDWICRYPSTIRTDPKLAKLIWFEFAKGKMKQKTRSFIFEVLLTTDNLLKKWLRFYTENFMKNLPKSHKKLRNKLFSRRLEFKDKTVSCIDKIFDIDNWESLNE